MLSVFIPLFVMTPVIGGSLVDIGIMTSIAALCSIPASFFGVTYVIKHDGTKLMFYLPSFL